MLSSTACPDYSGKSRLAGKNFLHTLFLFLLVTQICFAQWYEQNSGTTQNLNGVFFMDANNGLVIGDSGILIRTTNSGVDWELIPSGVTNDLTAMCFTDANNGWIVSDGLNTLGDSSVILHTTNGGLNWTKQWTVGRSTLSDIFFVDQQVGFTVGYVAPGGWEYSILLKTSDGGLTWTQLNYDSLNVPRQINFFDSNTGWLSWGGCAQGCWGGINKTIDGGATWFRKRGGYWKDIQFTDSNNAIAVSTGSMMEEQWGVVTKTTDGGETWSSQIIYAPGECLDLGFESIFSINNSIAVILGVLYGNCGGVICYWSTDGGATWIPQPTGIEQNMNRMFFTNELNGWIIGDNGTIFHTTNGGVSFVEEEQINEIPTEFLLSNNYPNPFNPSTKIKYSVPQSSQVQIKVFDVLGNEIETLVNEEKPVGAYELTWDAEQLPSGIYFYQFRAGDYISTKKMILIK